MGHRPTKAPQPSRKYHDVLDRRAIKRWMAKWACGWGDDVEMWRKWTPVLLPFEHRASFEAQQKLARGIFSLPRLQDGYTNILTDVEHSSEDTGDPLMAMLLLDPESEEWQNKALVIAQLMQDLLTANNDLGFLHLRVPISPPMKSVIMTTSPAIPPTMCARFNPPYGCGIKAMQTPTIHCSNDGLKHGRTASCRKALTSL